MEIEVVMELLQSLVVVLVGVDDSADVILFGPAKLLVYECMKPWLYVQAMLLLCRASVILLPLIPLATSALRTSLFGPMTDVLVNHGLYAAKSTYNALAYTDNRDNTAGARCFVLVRLVMVVEKFG